MSKMSIKLKTRETCLQFGSETRHSVPKITWGSFRGQRENKWGSFGGRGHFGIGIISGAVQASARSHAQYGCDRGVSLCN